MSFQIGVIRGIPIRLHITLLVTFLLLAMQLGGFGIPAGLVLFASVLLHELGHSVVAQSYGLRIAGIDLHLLGGVALMADSPRRPRHEVAIAAAGPLVSFLLAAAFGLVAWLTGAQLTLEGPRFVDLFAYGAVVNLGMAIFNLIPALPMDGGRIFRAALAERLGNLRATEIAVRVARGFAVAFGLLGFLTGQMGLFLIGVVVFLLSGHERRVARVKEQTAALRPPWFERLTHSRFAGSRLDGTVIDVTPPGRASAKFERLARPGPRLARNRAGRIVIVFDA